jgi:hypothetical protein
MLDLGHENRLYHWRPGGLILTRHGLRGAILHSGNDVATRTRMRFSELPWISLAIGARTISARDFLDLILIAPS